MTETKHITKLDAHMDNHGATKWVAKCQFCGWQSTPVHEALIAVRDGKLHERGKKVKTR